MHASRNDVNTHLKKLNCAVQYIALHVTAALMSGKFVIKFLSINSWLFHLQHLVSVYV